jgi:quaternary ammonium compound-resistance protein SugE
MSWIILLASGVLEAVWATALGASKGFTRIVPTTVFIIALVLSMAGLAWAMRVRPRRCWQERRRPSRRGRAGRRAAG